MSRLFTTLANVCKYSAICLATLSVVLCAIPAKADDVGMEACDNTNNCKCETTLHPENNGKKCNTSNAACACDKDSQAMCRTTVGPADCSS